MRMKISRCAAIAVIAAVFATSALAATHTSGPLTPFRNRTTRGGYTIDTVGDTLGQARPENTRLIIREDRKVGHEENTGLPISVSPQGGTSGYSGTGVGINLNKIFGPHGSYSYTKVDWPKAVFTSDKQLQVTLPNRKTFLL